ncbi:UDP-N-acetylmuramoyl-L-alanine--D-glutamate ligase [Sphingomonas alpina]|uniref:UDP-N-acetylmuramoylalanine--D-glutamate ligase n=1 Tax=Sphingomonas alpina TaxID=653931 RepID=A0A7H0LLG7_9SPHN|nr:UDP-N-acetylmuramoyl-L-alanine--D-glutamate ligase [Sphingomonas alpina]QNQ10520.1 UDP-N-acetylmuramoyl-L-alanine--D-glutamate ligase [Sphingomonas alpina]
MITNPAWRGKRFAVLGLARSGIATVRALVASGARVAAWDAKAEARAAVSGAEIADPEVIDLVGFDGLVVSPGVPINRHPVAAKARAAGVPIIGDIELFAQARAELPPHKVVGITGTNGKSTTTALIHHILETAGMPARLGGNIGKPILGEEPLPEGGVYVLELSSYQIDLTFSLDCDVAILLNITPDHLDRYDGFAGYVASKARLFAMQSAGHAAIIGIGEDASAGIARGLSARSEHLTRIAPGMCMDQSRWPSLQGPHNAQNALAAIAACQALGVSEAMIDRGLESFKGLPHRMELVASRGGVGFVNDSKATNPDSTAPALAAFERIHWILGGQAKSDNLDACAPHFGHIVRAYTIGEAGPRFAALLADTLPVEQSGTLAAAVTSATSHAVPGETVLLSPACASFDQFRDFEDRGDAFRKAVEALA